MRDANALEISAGALATAHYDAAIEHLLRFQPAVVDRASAMTQADPGAPMGYVLQAYLGLLSSEWPDALAAGEQIRALRAHAPTRNAREQGHLEAIEVWLKGDWLGAARSLAGLSATYPDDTLALFVGHQLDFFTGAARALCERVGGALLVRDATHPHHSFLTGMHAFGLEESGQYREAEALGRAAIERHPEDVWALHAVAHVCEMTGQTDAGLALYAQGGEAWLENNFLSVHNAWHRALFLLEREDYAGVLAGYDRYLNHAESPGIALELLDASALLWRLRLDGIDIGERWAPLAEAWARKDPRPWYAFNDVHAVMAFIGAGRLADARSVVARLEAYAATPTADETNAMMTARVGLPVARGLLAHGEQRYADVVAALWPVRESLALFGGSHAQRDAIQRTLLDALQRAGQHEAARDLLNQRLAERPDSRWAHTRVSQLGGGR